ncbi:IS1634 family transposase [Nocardia sp. NBC_00565]|uniref:IS1634 family transposase n=1 Tax=Nocardia sp. NBC_00565 TaxID=2975993 RepID=UPI002E809EBE|nr:IS1634 family transposase [Nocardia sp. NBC_00565]WUC00980.1 IS1634 family transposase [Nocardia sp. NBC_00565]
MYVRKVRTASGAVAVQVASKDRGRVRIVEHVGSAHTDAELGILLERARRIVGGGQGVLDLDVPDPVERVADVADFRAPALLPPEPRPAMFASAARTVGTSSRLLYDVLGGVYDRLGFGVVVDPVFRDLVIARIVEATSKADAPRVLADLGADPVSYKTIQRHLAQIGPAGYRDLIAGKCFAHAAATGGLSLVLYDVTTLYFEAEKEDDLRKVGYSKERRVDPQILVGLLVDRTGFPLEIGCFEGNTAETTTIVPIIAGFQARHGIAATRMVVAADAGMLSASNLTELDSAGLSFIVGSRTVKAPVDLASHFHWNGEVFTDGQIIDTVTPRHAKSQVNDRRKRAEPVWDPDTQPKAWRAVWQYSASRARRDQITLNAQEAKARAVIADNKQVKSTRFVKIAGKDRSLDEKALHRARALVGLKGYVTNLPVTKMPAAEVISKYHALWQVERSFRMSKTDLRARPMFHRTRDAIEAHLTIVFAALAVARAVQERTGLAIGNVVKQLRPLRTATITINGVTESFPPEIPTAQAEILDRLGPEPGY